MNRYQVSQAMVVEWPKLRVNGRRPSAARHFEPGAEITWLESCLEHRHDLPRFEQVVGRAVQRLCGSERFRDGMIRDEPLVEDTIGLTDGTRQFTALLVRVIELSRPLVVFYGTVPDAGARLWVTGSDEDQIDLSTQAAPVELSRLRNASAR